MVDAGCDGNKGAYFKLFCSLPRACRGGCTAKRWRFDCRGWIRARSGGFGIFFINNSVTHWKKMIEI
ncbi:hypothetical protein [Neisseria sp.]|uniref:hypothetical protein n=1 Tax=Neisseria sp. TaxID=192066 RepID=UPI0028A21B2D|nr:hypothetical protein [Neisseria sp.]